MKGRIEKRTLGETGRYICRVEDPKGSVMNQAHSQGRPGMLLGSESLAKKIGKRREDDQLNAQEIVTGQRDPEGQRGPETLQTIVTTMKTGLEVPEGMDGEARLLPDEGEHHLNAITETLLRRLVPYTEEEATGETTGMEEVEEGAVRNLTIAFCTSPRALLMV
jgi:hypothetical protein